MSLQQYLKSKYIIIAAFLFLFISCADKDNFGVSHHNRIIDLSFENDAGAITLDSTTRTVNIRLNEDSDLAEAIISAIEISPLATIEISSYNGSQELNVGDTIDLSSEKLITITAENGEESLWVLSATVKNGDTSTTNSDARDAVADFIEASLSSSSANNPSSSNSNSSSSNSGSSSSNTVNPSSSSTVGVSSSSGIRDRSGPQLAGSDFESWSTTGGKNYPQNDPDSVWDSGNYGSTLAPLLGVELTKSIALSDGLAAEMKTTSIIGKIASGSLFTGKFDTSLGLTQLSGLADGNDAIDFGIPFTEKPTGFSVKFQYTSAGNTNNGSPDECDIYVLLENHSGADVVRVATAWYRADSDNNTGIDGVVSISELDFDNLRTMEMDISYGSLPADAPALKTGHVLGDGTEDVTHITVVFASSALGNIFVGTSGSTLIIDDFTLLYN